jgi:glutamine synthetase
MLTAGLDGIEKGMTPPAPVEENVYEMTAKEREARGINTLPSNLLEAVEIAEKSEIVHRALGDHILNAFVENKKKEWDDFRVQVTKYEVDRYLPIL